MLFVSWPDGNPRKASARVHKIFAGTSEIMKEIIARAL